MLLTYQASRCIRPLQINLFSLWSSVPVCFHDSIYEDYAVICINFHGGNASCVVLKSRTEFQAFQTPFITVPARYSVKVAFTSHLHHIATSNEDPNHHDENDKVRNRTTKTGPRKTAKNTTRSEIKHAAIEGIIGIKQSSPLKVSYTYCTFSNLKFFSFSYWRTIRSLLTTHERFTAKGITT